MSTQQVGVDIGGTFTDTIAIDEQSGAVSLSKVPSTPANQATGFLNGLTTAGVEYAGISWLVHGTTVGTNATLERNGAKCGMIATRGFRDIVELGRRDRPQLYGLYGQFEPLISRENRLEVDERTDAEGNVVVALDEGQVERAAAQLRAQGCESLVIGFMHSYANRTHEAAAARAAERVWGNPYITQSAEILGEFRETERFGTAAINAYIQPLIHRYVTRLRDELRARGVPRDLVIMQANGGIIAADTAWRALRSARCFRARRPASIAAAFISAPRRLRERHHLDMGGTSFDVGMIVDGAPIVTSDRELELHGCASHPDDRHPHDRRRRRQHRLGRRGGHAARRPAQRRRRPGADRLRARRRPSRPSPTPTSCSGGSTPEKLLSVDGARRPSTKLRAAFDEHVGDAARPRRRRSGGSVLRIINDAMAGAIRLVSLQRGHDPREFALFAFGGAGPLHARGAGARARRAARHRALRRPASPARWAASSPMFVTTSCRRSQPVDRLADRGSRQRAARTSRAPARALVPRPRRCRSNARNRCMKPTCSTKARPSRCGSPSTTTISRHRAQRRAAPSLPRSLQHRSRRLPRQAHQPSHLGDRASVRSSTLRRIVATRPQARIGGSRVASASVWFDGGSGRHPGLRPRRAPLGRVDCGPAIFNQMDTRRLSSPTDPTSTSTAI